MKNRLYFAVFGIFLSIYASNAQSTGAKSTNVQTTRTASDSEVTSIQKSRTCEYGELQKPFVPRDSCQINLIAVHILDEELRPYSGIVIRIEYKDFSTKTWKLYNNVEAVLEYNEGMQEQSILIDGLPNGYYRVWAQCMRTQATGWVPMILDRTAQDDPLAIAQYTLHIPQRQSWLPQKQKITLPAAFLPAASEPGSTNLSNAKTKE